MEASLNVVIVDDDPDMADLLRVRLGQESESFDIKTLFSASECLEYIESNPVDCILSDYQMPEMDGMELLVALREKGNGVPFIFVTGQGNEEVAREAFKNGAFDYFTKEIGFAHFSKISNSVSRAIEQNRASAENALLESSLRKAAFGVSTTTGDDFFDKLVKYLAETVGTDYALVGELGDPDGGVVRTRSVYAKGDIVPDFEYELKDTPCENVMGKDVCCYTSGVRELFPEDELLKRMGVDSYAGTPLFDSSGKPLGILLVLDSKPIGNAEHVSNLLQLFAGRASAELERMKVEESLRRSEEKYRTLMDNASDAIFLGDPETGIIFDANSKAAELLGKPASEIAGLHQTEIHPPEEVERYAGMFREHMRSGGVPIEAEVVGKGGRHIPVEITANILEIDGKPVFQAIFRDLTERKKAESAATELGNILERSLNEIFLFDAEKLTFVRVNEGARKNLGYTMEELKKLTPLDIKPEFTYEKFEEMIAPLRSGKKRALAFTTTHKRKDGSLYPVEVHVQMSEYEGRSVFLAIILDITDRKEAEEALRESETRFRLIAENIDGVLWVTSPDDASIEYVSPAYEKVWGLSVDDLYDNPESWILAIHEDDRDDVLRELKAKARNEDNGYRYRACYRIVRPDGDVRWISDKGYPIQGRDGRPVKYVGIAQDITERMMVEDTLKKSEKFLADIFSSMRDGISVLDTDLNIVRVNRTIENWYSHSMPLVGKKCYAAYKGKDTPCEMCPTREALSTNEPATRIVPKFGSEALENEWVEVYSFPLIDSSTGLTAGVVEYMRDVTESLKTESTAVSLGRILEESMNEIYIYDAETLRFSMVNKGARENLGYSVDETTELTPLDLKPEYGQGSFEELLGPLRRGEKERVEFSTVHKRRDGSLYPVEVYLQMSTYAGRPVFAETARDITRRKRAESGLMRMNRMLKAVSDAQAKYLAEADRTEVFDCMLRDLLDLTHSEYGIIGEVVDEPDGGRHLRTRAVTNIAWDEATSRFYEENAKDGMVFRKLDNLFGQVVLTGQPVISNDPARDPRSYGLPEGHPPVRKFLGLPITYGDRLVGMAGVANRPSGYSEKTVEYLKPFMATCGSIIESERGAVLRKQMEESLRKSEAGLRSIIEALPDMVLVLGRDGTILDVKYFSEEEFARMRGDGGSYNFMEVLPVEVSDMAGELLAAVFDDGEMRSFEYQTSLPQQGVMHYEARLVKGAEDTVIALVRDVTEHRELERQKADMLAMVRHDVKTPLSLILGYVDIMMKDKALELDGETVDMAASIRKNAMYISGMLDDIVDIFRIEAGGRMLKKKMADPEEIVLEVKANASGTARDRNIELVRSVEEGLPDIEVDGPYIMRALTNLLQNALTFTQEGGRVTVGAERSTVAGREYVSLWVEDNGPGIPEEEQERVFEKYYRSPRTRKVKGSGLGLAIVRAIAEAHGGRVKLRSAPDAGSRFDMLIPLARD